MASNIPPRWKAQLALSADTLADRPPPKRPRRRRQEPGVPSEEAEQLELAYWLDAREVLWAHIPNGGFRHVTTAVRLKRLGVKPGVPDVLVFTPPPAYPSARGAAVELKRVNVRRASPLQQEWLVAMGAVGWCVKVCSGSQEAIAWLLSLGY
jgi:hypothetical protein